jgi:hypothetical protein
MSIHPVPTSQVLRVRRPYFASWDAGSEPIWHSASRRLIPRSPVHRLIDDLKTLVARGNQQIDDFVPLGVPFHGHERWLVRLTASSSPTTFSENRLHRFRESDVFRHIFERVVAACMVALVKGEGFAVDASVIEANASRYHGKAPDEIEWAEPVRRTRAVKEYLARLEAENEPNPDRKPPKVISPSDPCSAWTAKANKRVQFGYGLNYLIDIENAVIVDVEATPARTYNEVAATKTMIERTDERLGLKPKRLAADTAYGTGKFLGWLLDAGIAPHIPVWDKSARDDGTLSLTIRCCKPAAPCTKAGRFSIVHPSSIAMSVPSRCSVVLRSLLGKSPAIFTKVPATWRAG